MKNLITPNGCTIHLDAIGRRAYANSRAGREMLNNDLANDHNDLLNQILSIWGDSPIFPDEPAPTLDELKTIKRDEIAAARYAAETGGIEVNGARIATDRGSQALLTAAVVMARLDPEFKTQWKCADGSFKQLDAFQLSAIGDAVIAHVESCFAREGELCEQIDAAQTPEELDSIRWSL